MCAEEGTIADYVVPSCVIVVLFSLRSILQVKTYKIIIFVLFGICY